MVLPAHALEAVQVRLKSASNEGHFTLWAQIVFSQYHPAHCSGVCEICHIETSEHALQLLQVRLKSVSNEGHFSLEA
jgi:hypothetical protein